MTDARPGALAGLRGPLRIIAVVLLLVALGSCAKGAEAGESLMLFALAGAALFGSWLVGAPPPREREGMLDGALDDAGRRLTETRRQRERRRVERWFD